MLDRNLFWLLEECQKKRVCVHGCWRNATNPSIACCVATGHHNQTTPTVVDIKLRQLHHVMVIESWELHPLVLYFSKKNIHFFFLKRVWWWWLYQNFTAIFPWEEYMYHQLFFSERICLLVFLVICLAKYFLVDITFFLYVWMYLFLCLTVLPVHCALLLFLRNRDYIHINFW